MNSRLESAVSSFLENRGLSQVSDCSVSKDLPFVTIGVCVKNSEKEIRECLTSIVNSNYDKSKMEIIVIDGNSADNTVAVAREVLEKSDIVYKILSDEGKGLGHARQIIVDNARGEHVCWVDADSIVLSDFVANEVKSLENNPMIGVVMPLILFDEANFFARLQGYAWLLPTLNAAVKGKTPNLALNGALTPVKALMAVGGFDTNIKGAGEDVELFERMRIKGYKVAISPRAQLYHSVESSWRELLRRLSWWAKGSAAKEPEEIIE